MRVSRMGTKATCMKHTWNMHSAECNKQRMHEQCINRNSMHDIHACYKTYLYLHVCIHPHKLHKNSDCKPSSLHADVK